MVFSYALAKYGANGGEKMFPVKCPSCFKCLIAEKIRQRQVVIKVQKHENQFCSIQLKKKKKKTDS